MKFNIVTGVAAIALALTTAAAFAAGPQIGDGSNSPTAPNQYNLGSGSAKVGDGSNSPTAPNQYNLGAGTAQKDPAGNQYNQGSAQSLAPPATMGQYEQTGQKKQ